MTYHQIMEHFLIFRRNFLPTVAAFVLIMSGVVFYPQSSIANSDFVQSRPLVVVELFTSQGCSSCPPADKFLTDLMARGDVLPLSLHVDYWDYIGWKDPFASPLFTNRQRQYASKMALRYVYTPQMVIQGVYQAVGSRRGEVLGMIEQAKSIAQVPITLTRKNGDIRLSLGAYKLSSAVDVIAVFFDKRHETPIRRGENSGRKMINSNVVRDLKRVTRWDGDALSLKITSDWENKTDATAIVLQSRTTGEIIGAAQLDL